MCPRAGWVQVGQAVWLSGWLMLLWTLSARNWGGGLAAVSGRTAARPVLLCSKGSHRIRWRKPAHAAAAWSAAVPARAWGAAVAAAPKAARPRPAAGIARRGGAVGRRQPAVHGDGHGQRVAAAARQPVHRIKARACRCLLLHHGRGCCCLLHAVHHPKVRACQHARHGPWRHGHGHGRRRHVGGHGRHGHRQGRAVHGGGRRGRAAQQHARHAHGGQVAGSLQPVGVVRSGGEGCAWPSTRDNAHTCKGGGIGRWVLNASNPAGL